MNEVTPAAVLLATLAAEPEPAEPAEPEPNVIVPIVHGAALLTVMRIGASVLWPDPFSRTEHFGARYEEAFTKPPKFESDNPAFRWDGDSVFINLVGHGLFGSELYLRARQCHLGAPLSFAFAAAGSTLWEYAIEANGVRPSAQDLVYTPLMGLVLGEGRYVAYRAAAGLSSPGLRGAVRSILDPFGELERLAGTPC
jgi:hypothetical protein